MRRTKPAGRACAKGREYKAAACPARQTQRQGQQRKNLLTMARLGADGAAP
ncbi:hypothetical protein SF06_31050 [Pseudomonas flexibilis]|nr:hypothetical protein SF06_31050 [Pseudomonas flexibilis]